MKPTNQNEKKKASRKFLLLYLLSISAIFLCSFFAFTSPVNILKQEVKKNDEFKTQHEFLTERTSVIASQINSLEETEKKNVILPAPDFNSIEEYKESIRNAYNKLKDDSAKITSPELSRNLNNYLTTFKTVIFYCQYNIGLRKANISLKELASNKGDNAVLMMQQQNKIEQLQSENSNLRVELAKKSGGGGAGPALPADYSDLKKENNSLTLQRDSYKRDLDESNKQLEKLKDQLKAGNTSEPATNPAAGCSDADKARILFQSADELAKQGKVAKKDLKKGYFSAALDILQSPDMRAYTDKGKLRTTISEINKLITPPENF